MRDTNQICTGVSQRVLIRKKGATLGSPEAAPLSSRYYFLNVFQIMAKCFNSLRALQRTEGLFFNFFMQQKWSVNF